MYIEELTKLIQHSFASIELDGFTGFGVVIIEQDFCTLPISPLLELSDNSIYVESMDEVNKFLFDVSRSGDIRHDGFHIYYPEKKVLVISQYFSPPIQSQINNVVYNVGARVRAAQYGSLCQGVLGVITVGNSGKIYQALDGVINQVTN